MGGQPSIQLACYPGKGTSYGVHPDICISVLSEFHSKIRVHLTICHHSLTDTSVCTSISMSPDMVCLVTGNVRCAARHADASESAPYRIVTAILYLNSFWHQGSGGELCIYNHSQGE